MKKHINSLPFPGIESILHFEGSRGPDGIKMKSPGRDEPWHFIDPQTATLESPLLRDIRQHQFNLAMALAHSDDIRASFEAAWLAHAVTDGLTPAHHEPLEEQLKALKNEAVHGEKLRGKLVMASNGSKRQFVKNNWSYWGAKGIMTTHTLFEGGVATAAKPLSFKIAAADAHDIEELQSRGFGRIYLDMVHVIDELGMYERFKRDGWTGTLARQTTKTLIPTIVHAVELAWLEAYYQAMEVNS